MAKLLLPPDICTPQQLGSALAELRIFLNRLQDRAARQKVSGVSELPPSLSQAARNILEINGLSPQSLQLATFTVELEKLRDTAPVAHFVLAELPEAGICQQLTDWFRQNIHASSLLTFSSRSDIGGGFLLRAGGKQYDFTFRSQLLDSKARISVLFNALLEHAK